VLDDDVLARYVAGVAQALHDALKSSGAAGDEAHSRHARLGGRDGDARGSARSKTNEEPATVEQLK
jgi:hypothetical protein